MISPEIYFGIAMYAKTATNIWWFPRSFLLFGSFLSPISGTPQYHINFSSVDYFTNLVLCNINSNLSRIHSTLMEFFPFDESPIWNLLVTSGKHMQTFQGLLWFLMYLQEWNLQFTVCE